MLIALLLTLSTALPEQPAVQDPKVIRVFVQTDDGGNADELSARRESVRHLQSVFADKKKASIVVVTIEDDADLVVEVEQRSVTVPKVVIGLSGGMGSPTGRPGAPSGPVKVARLHVALTMARGGDPEQVTSKNRANETESGWKSAAEDVGKQVEKWIVEHRSAIIAARGR